MGLGNPVGPGRIQANGEKWDGTSFQVTATFQQHAATGRALGIDFGNLKCGGQIWAMADGVVSQVIVDPNGANILRIRHSGTDVSGYAHWSTTPMRAGMTVKRGQVIAAVGKTGADACHCHAGYTVNGREIDFWPMLDQNLSGADMTTIVDSVLFVDAAGNPTTRPIHFDAGTYTGYRLDGGKKAVTVGASGSSAPANATCTILQSPDKDPHGPNWLRITAGSFLGFYVRKGTGITVPDGPDATASYNAGVDAAATKAKEAHK